MTRQDEEKLGPVDHIARHALPWRNPHLTECGKPLREIDAARIITRDEVRARVNAIGKRRAVFSLCLTCLETAGRHPDTLIDALHREAGFVASQGRYHYGYSPERLRLMDPAQRAKYDRERARTVEFLAEIEAVEALVAAHREEFDDYIRGVGETESLADRRAARNLRKARAAHPRNVL